MPDKPTFGKLDIRLGTPPGEEPADASDHDAPFLIVVLGDFSGRANRSMVETGAKLAQRAVRWVDRDNLEQVMQQLKVGLTLALESDAGVRLKLNFAELAGPDMWERHWAQHALIVGHMRDAQALAAEIREQVKATYLAVAPTR